MQQHNVNSARNIDAVGLGACGLVKLQRSKRTGRDIDEQNIEGAMVGLRCSSRGIDRKENCVGGRLPML